VEATKAHYLRLAQGGLTGLLIQGSNGEAQHLSHSERSELIRLARTTLDENGFQNTVVIAGTGAQSTREAIVLCEKAKEAGASFALVLTPCTWVSKMSEEAVLTFHRTVADKSPIPTMVYNFPTVTAGQNLTSNVISKLAEHPNIVGTKLSCGDIGKLHRLTMKYRVNSPGANEFGDFATFPGKSDVYLAGLTMSSYGIIGALVNLAPKVHVKLWELFKAGKMQEAIKMQEVLSAADEAVSRVGGIGAMKIACKEYFGYGMPIVRGPLLVPDKMKVLGENDAAEWIKRVVEMEKIL